MIAKALLHHPSILLLDEPTNHLDREGIDWFLEFLRAFRGTVFAISHDRELLEKMTRIFEIKPDDHSFDFYVGGWRAYKEQRAERISERQDAYDEQQKEKKRLEERLRWRQIQASARSNPVLGAQVRMMKRRIEREITSQEIARPKSLKTLANLSLPGAVHDAKLLLAFREVSFALGEKMLFRNASFEVRGKERVILAGKNGSGKSTLLKIAMGLYHEQSGEVKIGANVHIGYFAQEHENLNPEETVLESFENTDRLRADIRDSRSILATFLFVNNALQKKVKELSPGERVRLLFAKLVHQENELLLLDEPTNHLDIESKEVIETALAEFEGGILAVSHDPYFIEAIGVTRTLQIEKGTIK
jgi:ATPase subunit of ABC transporter with duplicated ATPase domains